LVDHTPVTAILSRRVRAGDIEVESSGTPVLTINLSL
jgi:hypothetical protein